MGWGAEQSAYAVTGGLLLLSGAIAGYPRAGVRHGIRVGALAVAAIFIAGAFLSGSRGFFSFGPWLWISAFAPAVFLAVVIGRILRTGTARHQVLDCVVPGRAAHRRDGVDSVAAEALASSRLKAAADPLTSGAELADLAYAYADVRVAIATNPSTPANVLGWLVSIGGDEVAQAIARRSPRK